MIELDGSVVTPQGLTDYWEASWMFTRGGVYYMVYAANDTDGCVTSSSYACRRYATASTSYVFLLGEPRGDQRRLDPCQFGRPGPRGLTATGRSRALTAPLEVQALAP
ncbi:hypothetical protein ABZ860_38270 [Microbispora sp. NPDC046973]|uniref:hypothetical protein n=1 Tax=Microbispora sp. NPDC046973 TaxID=3155022 RepID=UPI0034052EF7